MPNDDLATQQCMLRVHTFMTEDLKRANALAQRMGFENTAAFVMYVRALGKDLGFKNIRSFYNAVREEKHVEIVALGQKHSLAKMRVMVGQALVWEGVLKMLKMAGPHALKVVVGGKK